MTTYIPSLTIPSAVLQHPAASVLLPIALGTAVGFGTRPAETQKTYLALKQPPLRPPPWVFGPVWTVLYGLMGYASHRIATIGLSSVSPAVVETAQSSLTLYTIQLGLNLAWMPLFFVAKRPVEASVNIVTLLGLNGYLAYVWGSIDEVAGWCQVPYLGWLGFATYLCVGAGHLNDWDLQEKEVKKE
ncbi:translocator protein [Pochonia chlamydosporia 170]|uniref:Translocator protein n=1 Tax=Pochonia chlamydosporia 170 TaxID=1380566 RepID=A0A179G5B4_METCM|nr:translocator protein [Pochonia chlamydosporia 170]OAQ72658.1 translocator protein [Pochonia chlamydosporia 170]